ncbi:TetR/AcrR family transcriptional regulator [Actinotalea sp. M2MS4P-6]|uniref:TetR/AcrR family transcriptional regulator n=1 Tax=Actinotalea sp. M2MS4P-6 TaxID=2983762 RepID=UPI0021E45BC5|nr:TetR/AcrR family transcriptional regulator [Actinotalea sp. M2MS4P-6]MCV2394757.1 TetR/AcrR family transcriptional regulator [Actinotalea sp. M2MS4P-6]
MMTPPDNAPEGAGRRPPGRPRDLEAEARLLAAGMEVYGERGWYGFTANEVIRRAKVGKATYHSRWSSLGEFLAACFDEALAPLQHQTVEGDVREILIAQGRLMADLYFGPHRLATQRLWAEYEVVPDPLRRVREVLTQATVHRARRLVASAVADGQLPAGLEPDRLLEPFEGGIYMHIATASPENRDEVRAGIDAYIQQLADDLLAAIPVAVARES